MIEILFSLTIGLGIFLYGMHMLEKTLAELGNVRIKHWLGRATRHPASSVVSGTVITAVLQSSSMVSLIVLAFVSAGLIPLFNAVGVILGANLGTTFTGWIVATIGFKLDLDAFGIPLIGLGALGIVFFKKASIQLAAGLLLGLGFLLFGLDFMKDSVTNLRDLIEPTWLSQLNLPLFLLFGMLFTAVIQSSSAMTLIALTALNGGVIDLTSAAAIVVGADIGTTSTTALGSLKSSPVAKQLALAHVSYNICVDAIAFIVLIPVLPEVLAYFDIQDPLYGLVLFHSAFNLLGLFIFVPFLKPFSAWLSGFFNHDDEGSFLNKNASVVPEAGVVALVKELDLLLLKVLSLNMHNLKLEPGSLTHSDQRSAMIDDAFRHKQSFEERYENLKVAEGQIHQFISGIDFSSSRIDMTSLIFHITSSARQLVYAAKSLKDVRGDLVGFRKSFEQHFGHEEFEGQTAHVHPDLLVSLYQRYFDFLTLIEETKTAHQRIYGMKHHNELLHHKLHEQILKAVARNEVQAEEIATVLNTNRELWHSNINLIEGLEHLLSARDQLVEMLGNRSKAAAV